jgi:hypothetical protein
VPCPNTPTTDAALRAVGLGASDRPPRISSHNRSRSWGRCTLGHSRSQRWFRTWDHLLSFSGGHQLPGSGGGQSWDGSASIMATIC